MRVGSAPSAGTSPASVGVEVNVGVGGVGEMVGVQLGVDRTVGVDVPAGIVGVANTASISSNEQADKPKARMRLKTIFLMERTQQIIHG